MAEKLDSTLRMLGMSISRARAESRISGLDDVILLHTMKVLLYPKSSYVIGWKKEIRDWLLRCATCGNNIKGGKNLKKEDYMNFLDLLIATEHHVSILKESIVESMKPAKIKPINITDKDLFDKVCNVYSEMTELLAKDPLPEEIYEFVSILG